MNKLRIWPAELGSNICEQTLRVRPAVSCAIGRWIWAELAAKRAVQHCQTSDLQRRHAPTARATFVQVLYAPALNTGQTFQWTQD